jgi:hypothetical protein
MSLCNECGKNYFPGHYCVPLERKIKTIAQQAKAKNCDHRNAVPYFGPVHSCPDCNEMPIQDINKPGKQWRKSQ